MKNIYFKNSKKMSDVKNESVDLIITSPPYFNIKDYAKNGYQDETHSESSKGQIGDITNYKIFIKELQKVWKECERVLKPNGKLIINTPLMPMKKKEFTTHYNRHIFDLNSDIQTSIIYRKNTEMFLFDTYIWNRTNTSKGLMFGSYPYPRNFYAQNTSEFITVYVKDGIPKNGLPSEIKEKSKLSQKEWVEYTKQIWNIPIPNKSDLAFGEHSAIMPEEIVKRCVRLFSFVGDTVLDPFTGSGTTLKVAKQLQRNYIGYEIMENYKSIIEKKLNSV
jgi:site-specific DNA-methyltransferase (cytosine-N4-specific)